MKTTELLLHIMKSSKIPAKAIPQGVQCHFKLAGNRSQVVDIRQVARIREGLTIIAFESLCQRLKSGFVQGLSGAQALRLLRFNSVIPIGAFCIIERESEEYLAVRSTQILETMDTEELTTHCTAVAQLADQWENRLGKDEF